MVGRDVVFRVEKEPSKPGEVVLDVKEVRAENDKGLPALRGLSLNVRAGEIVGVAGGAGPEKPTLPNAWNHRVLNIFLAQTKSGVIYLAAL